MDTATINTTTSKWISRNHSVPNQPASLLENKNTAPFASWRRHRRVHFSSAEENDTQDESALPKTELTPDMIPKLWYSHEEIDRVKQQVRSIVCPYHRSEDVGTGRDIQEEIELSILQRYGPQRSGYRKRTLRCILKAQNTKTRDPEILRQISLHCTSWARALAANQGLEDYCEVYDPLDSLLDSTNVHLVYPPGINNNTPKIEEDDSHRKRRQNDNDDDEGTTRIEVSKRRRLETII